MLCPEQEKDMYMWVEWPFANLGTKVEREGQEGQPAFLHVDVTTGSGCIRHQHQPCARQ